MIVIQPNDEGGKRPDRAVTVYAQKCREAFNSATIVIGEIKASLRRIAHYYYWSDKVRRQYYWITRQILLYGNAERAIADLTHRFARGETPKDMRDVRGIAFATNTILNGWTELDLHDIDNHEISLVSSKKKDKRTVIRLASCKQVSEDPETYAHAPRLLHIESNPGIARPLIQKHGYQNVWVTEPPILLTTKEMDDVFALPYARAPHPVCEEAKIPA